MNATDVAIEALESFTRNPTLNDLPAKAHQRERERIARELAWQLRSGEVVLTEVKS